MVGLARRIDHVVIETGDEEQLLGLLHGTLGLPLAWPLDWWAGKREAGVAAGNCNIGCNHTINPGRDANPELTLVALQPIGLLDAVVVELAERGLSPSEPAFGDASDLPEEGAYEPWRRGWATVLVWSGPEFPMAFFCAYDHDMTVRAASERTRFDSANGGPFGVTGLKAITVSTPDVAREMQAWAAVLGDEAVQGDDVVSLPGSPELRFRPGARASGLVFAVRSLAQAGSAAAERRLSHEAGRQLRLDPADCLGLDIAFE